MVFNSFYKEDTIKIIDCLKLKELEILFKIFFLLR